VPDLYGPFDGSTFAQAPWFRDRGPLEPSGVVGPPAANAAAGELGLTAAGFGLTLGLGRAHVRGAAYERTGTAWTDTVPANTSTAGPRNDLLVLRRSLTAKTVVPLRVQGTAAATPTDPAITQTEDTIWDLPLFRVQAPPSSGTPLVITDLRPWLDGGALQILPPVYGGSYADGSAPYDPLRLYKRGTACELIGSFTYTGGGGAGTGTFVSLGSLPAGVVPTGVTIGTCAIGTGSGWGLGLSYVEPSGLLQYNPVTVALPGASAGRVVFSHRFRSTT
jgi:hypothetical protein